MRRQLELYLRRLNSDDAPLRVLPDAFNQAAKDEVRKFDPTKREAENV